MSKEQKLAYGEKRLALFSSEKARDRADAKRQIAGLSQGDQQIALLNQVSDALWQQNQMLAYLCQAAHRQAHGTSGDLPLPPIFG